MDAIISQSQVLIGKKIFAEGWQYDNSGMISGSITAIVKSFSGISVCVEPESELSMRSFTFRPAELETLLAEGKLPVANKFLNSGTNAYLI